MSYKIIRARDAGVFFGIIESVEGRTVVLLEARRLWYWVGAASLSELAVKGTAKPTECKFPIAVPKITIFDVCEILDCTDKAIQSIQAVPIWGCSNE